MIDFSDNAGQFLIINGEFKQDGQGGLPFEGQISKVYEVIRLINGIPLFLEDHYERLKNSLSAIGQSIYIELNDLKDQINLVRESAGLKNFNVKIILYTGNGKQDSVLYISKSNYPSQADFEAGVTTGLFCWERENPNAKILKEDYKAAVSKAISDKQVFEVLLLNTRGEITEGSKSNVFFLLQGQIRTAPGNVVLKGITRKYIIDACKSTGLEVVEQPVTADMLAGIDAAFISGTSIKVLPISGIEQFRFSSGNNPAIKAIRNSYDKMLDAYINSRQL